MTLKKVSLFSLHWSLKGLLLTTGFVVFNANAQIISSDIMCNVSEGVTVVSKSKTTRVGSSSKKGIFSPRYARSNATLKSPLYPASIVKVQGRVFLVGQAGSNLVEQKMLYEGGELQLNDVVQTDNQSFISIRLGDGTISMLPSNSRVQLSQSSHSVGRYILQKGSVQNKVIKQPRARTNTFEIQTPGSTIGVRGTEFSVRDVSEYDRSVIALAVEEGKVWVQSRNSCVPPTIVDKGFGALMGTSVQKVALLPAPNLKNPDNAQPNKFLHFALQPVAGAVRYRAQVLGDINVLDTLTEQYSEQPDLTLDVPNLQNGYYYVKLTAFDALGIESLSKTYLFLRNRNTRTE